MTQTSVLNMSLPTSILYQSNDKTIVILDIPRTLEECQVLPTEPHPEDRRIYSAQPVAEPFDTPEPTRNNGSSLIAVKSQAAQIADLMTAATIQGALSQIHASYHGPICLPRIVVDGATSAAEEGFKEHQSKIQPCVPAPTTEDPYIPDEAKYYDGSLQDLSATVRETAPTFDLIVLDPPWPNRSAKRKADSYAITSNLSEMRLLLDHVPVATHLSQNGGLVAVWITNRSSILEFVTSPASGLFALWGLELVAEWTWVKVTSSGEPIYDVDSAWRKPWEKLLIAKRRGAATPAGLVSKTLIAVPDLHSRKPNLRGLFEPILGATHIGLEVFARNLTAGWCSWGDEALKFQQREHWSSTTSSSTR